jgi:hypothetical protein
MDYGQWTSWTSWTGGGAPRNMDRQRAPLAALAAMDGLQGQRWPTPAAGRNCNRCYASRRNWRPWASVHPGPRVHRVHNVHRVHPPKPPALASATLCPVSIRGPGSIVSMMSIMSIAGVPQPRVRTAPAVTTAGGARPMDYGQWTSWTSWTPWTSWTSWTGGGAPRTMDRQRRAACAALAAMDGLQGHRGQHRPQAGTATAVTPALGRNRNRCCASRRNWRPWSSVHPGPRVHRVHNVHRVHPPKPPAVASATLCPVSIRGPGSIWSIMSIMSIAGVPQPRVRTAPAVTTAGGARPMDYGQWTSWTS